MNELLELALRAHGGLDRWREVKSLDARVSLTGALYQLKGYAEGVPNVTMRIDTRRPAVTISPYARPDHRGYFTPDRVWIEDRSGQIVEQRSNPRASFAGHVVETPWDQLHRLYFTSYAMWNYLTTPFGCNTRAQTQASLFSTRSAKSAANAGVCLDVRQRRTPTTEPDHTAAIVDKPRKLGAIHLILCCRIHRSPCAESAAPDEGGA